MRDVLAAVDRWRATGEPVALATVVAVRGSAPRPVGAKLAVGPQREIAGGVSGGCVEGAVVTAAEQVLGGAAPTLLSFGIPDDAAFDVGLPCGGEIDVWVERWEPRWHDPFATFVRDAGRAALATVLDGPHAGARLLLHAAGGEGTPSSDAPEVLATADAPSSGAPEILASGDAPSSGAPEVLASGDALPPALETELHALASASLWAGESVARRVGEALALVEVQAPPPRLLVFGAIDVADALCAAVRPLGWRPFVIDPRAAFATRARMAAAEQLLVCWPEEGVRRLGGIDRATAVVTLAHDPRIDDAALRLALASDAAYVGAMGSRRAHADRLERLRAAGVPEEQLARLRAPVGLDLGGVTPAETALAIAAELVAARRGRAGGSLREARGPIHPRSAA
jgi:xanthine dehydrogenase accessory factor